MKYDAMLKGFMGFIKSSIFSILLLLVFLIILSVLFWFWSPLISFNDSYIFVSPFLRFGIIFVVWSVIFLLFFLKPIISFFASLKSEKRVKLKELKKESNSHMLKAKRNFFIALQDAKAIWKRGIKFRKLPLIIIIGDEGAGKSTFINYSNIEYPISDSLHSYKKFHQSTNNFSLYVSKNGALLDTEGNYFSQEKLFNPSNSDELPNDDLDKHKEFIIKKNVWRAFLIFLNKSFFHSKLNGVVLVIDTIWFLNNPREYTKDTIRYLVKRVNECETSLNIKFPIYVVFSKLDLLDGMKEFFETFDNKIADRALGISFRNTIDENTLYKELKEISQSLFVHFINKNHLIHSLDDKNKFYLFLKQLDNLFALAKDFLLELQGENALKNNSLLRGVYFVSAYQENIPRNVLLDSVCDKYHIKKILAKTTSSHNKKSYFVGSLLKDVIFKDCSLSSTNNILKKASLLLVALIIGLGTYFSCSYFVYKDKIEKDMAENTLDALRVLLSGLDYENLNIEEKVNLLANVKGVLETYPELSKKSNAMQYISLNISHKGFIKAQEFYYKLGKDVFENTLLKEMEYILQTEKTDADNLVKTLYMYKSLFEQEHLNKDLLKIWIDEHWQHFSKYHISKQDFLSMVDDVQKIENFTEDDRSIDLAAKNLEKMTARIERLYVLLNVLYGDKKIYKIKDELGPTSDNVFAQSSKINSIDNIYTKDGMLKFLQNLSQNIESVASIESWMLAKDNNMTQETKNTISMEVLKLYLKEYQDKWEELLTSIAPREYDTKDSMLNELSILSKKDNPLSTLIKTVGINTNLNKPSVLREAYNMGLNTSGIKTHFSNITNFFDAYHRIAEQDSTSNSEKLVVDANTQDDVMVMDALRVDIKNIQNKIVDFSTNNAQSIEDKIAYVISHKKEPDDPFVSFTNDIKKLPVALENYYTKLQLYAWELVETDGISLFNTAWFDEVYTPFIDDIAPFYPFNENSIQELNMDLFKGFFGRNGTLNKFYDKYLSSVLSKRINSYSLNAQSNVKINFSKGFLDFFKEAKNLSNLMLDLNDNIKVDFTLQSANLSADFSYIELQYNSNSMRYDHTLRTSLRVIGEQFNSNTNLHLKAFDYYNVNTSYDKTYTGEWAWYRFLKENRNNGRYSVIFNNNQKLYFDFDLVDDASNINEIITTLSGIRMVKSITTYEREATDTIERNGAKE